jgi:hypothetical protein
MYMHQHAIAAAKQINVLPRSQRSLKFKEAIDNFEALIDEMAEAAKSIPGYEYEHPDSIGEITIEKALDKLCPLWPFLLKTW